MNALRKFTTQVRKMVMYGAVVFMTGCIFLRQPSGNTLVYEPSDNDFSHTTVEIECIVTLYCTCHHKYLPDYDNVFIVKTSL